MVLIVDTSFDRLPYTTFSEARPGKINNIRATSRFKPRPIITKRSLTVSQAVFRPYVAHFKWDLFRSTWLGH